MPRVFDKVRLIEDVASEFSNRVHPVGTEGRIVEVYYEPAIFSVNLEWANPRLVGGLEYDNVALQPSQFVVIDIEEPNA